MRKLLGLSSFFFLGACASVSSVSLTPIPAHKGPVIKTEVSKWTFLGISFNNEFVDPIVDNLKKKCPNGMVTGILTKDEFYNYFLVFKHNIEVTGFCNTATTASSSTPRKPSSDESEGLVNE